MTTHHRALVQALQEAAALVDPGAGSSPEEASRCFHEAFTRVIRARNHVMQTLAGKDSRAASAAPAVADGTQVHLGRINALLSLMASFDFPLAGFHPERLDAARHEIGALLAAVGEAAPV